MTPALHLLLICSLVALIGGCVAWLVDNERGDE